MAVGRARRAGAQPRSEKAKAEISGSAAADDFSALIKAVVGGRGVRGRKQQGNTGQRGTKISVFTPPPGCGLLLFSFFSLPTSNPLGPLSFREH